MSVKNRIYRYTSKKISKNKWIKNKRITYTDEFKIKVVKECENYNKFAREVFEEYGIDSDIVGKQRIYSSIKRWRIQYKNTGELKDTQQGNSGRNLE